MGRVSTDLEGSILGTIAMIFKTSFFAVGLLMVRETEENMDLIWPPYDLDMEFFEAKAILDIR